MNMMYPEMTQAQQDAMKEHEKQSLLSGIRQSASWFYWIGALTLVNTICDFMGGSMAFAYGSGISQVIDAFADPSSPFPIAKWLAALINVVIVGLTVLWGVLASKGLRWVFITGMIIYLIDAIVTFMLKRWIGAAFHLYALYNLFIGLRLSFELAKLNEYKPFQARPVYSVGQVVQEGQPNSLDEPHAKFYSPYVKDDANK